MLLDVLKGRASSVDVCDTMSGEHHHLGVRLLPCFALRGCDLACGLFELGLQRILSCHIIHLALEPASLPPAFVPVTLPSVDDSSGHSSRSAHALQRAAPPDSGVAALEMATAGCFPERAVGMAMNAHVPSVASDGAAGSLAGSFVAGFQRG